MLVKSVEVRFNGAAAAFEMCNEPCDGVMFAAEADAAQARQVLL